MARLKQTARKQPGKTAEEQRHYEIRGHDSSEVKKFKEAARARQENVNGRMKEFALMDKRWIYHRDKHLVVFQAVVVLVQYDTSWSSMTWRRPAPCLIFTNH
jgi:NADPH:quinone reductase-like Zn-dependent oxidoreductase